MRNRTYGVQAVSYIDDDLSAVLVNSGNYEYAWNMLDPGHVVKHTCSHYSF